MTAVEDEKATSGEEKTAESDEAGIENVGLGIDDTVDASVEEAGNAIEDESGVISALDDV